MISGFALEYNQKRHRIGGELHTKIKTLNEVV